MTLTLDTTLAVSAEGPPPGRLGATAPPVAIAAPAGAAPFLLDGERMAVTGTEARGEHAFWAGGLLVARALTTDAGACANVVAAPASLRRELVGPSGTLFETTLVAPALPLAAVQWSATEESRWPGSLLVSITLLPGRRAVRHHARGGTVRCVSDEADDQTVELRLHPDPRALEISEAHDGGVQVRASVAGPAPVTLLLSAGPGDAVARAMDAAAHLAAHEARAASDADPATMDTLVTTTGVRELDRAVVWATLRLRSAFARGAYGPADDVFWAGLGALAVGDEATGARAVEALGRHAAGPEPRILGMPTTRNALATILAARLTLLSGDPAHALRARAALDIGALATGRPEDPGGWTLGSFALTTLADALRFAAPDADIAKLREAAAPRRARAGRVRLPLVGDPVRDSAAALLRGFLAATREPLVRLGTTEGTPLEAWARWAAGDPTGAWAVWRSWAGLGLMSGKSGRGTWDPPVGAPGPGAGTGILLCGLAYGLLGLAPDAPSGRLCIAPALPRHMAALEATGIRVGEARLAFRFRRTGRTYAFELEPTGGRVPITIILEPSLPGTFVSEARVDGDRVDLDARRFGSRTRVAVQLPLDAPRRLEVDVHA